MSTAVKQRESLPGLKIGVPPPLFSTREGGAPETCGAIKRAVWTAGRHRRQRCWASSDGKTPRSSKSVITSIGTSQTHSRIKRSPHGNLDSLDTQNHPPRVTLIPSPKHRTANPDTIRLPGARPHPGSFPYFPRWGQRAQQVTARTTRPPSCQNL